MPLNRAFKPVFLQFSFSVGAANNHRHGRADYVLAYKLATRTATARPLVPRNSATDATRSAAARQRLVSQAIANIMAAPEGLRCLNGSRSARRGSVQDHLELVDGVGRYCDLSKPSLRLQLGEAIARSNLECTTLVGNGGRVTMATIGIRELANHTSAWSTR